LLGNGDGIIHMASAKNRQAMHGKEEELADSLRMYRWGLDRGKPPAGAVGVAPEWFYKGGGDILRGRWTSPLAEVDLEWRVGDVTQS
jgi:hypothetical protein